MNGTVLCNHLSVPFLFGSSVGAILTKKAEKDEINKRKETAYQLVKADKTVSYLHVILKSVYIHFFVYNE